MNSTDIRRNPADFEYPSPEVSECPYTFYAALRETSPVFRLRTGEFIVSRWDDVVESAQNMSVFSSNMLPVEPELRRAYVDGNEAAGSRYTPWPAVYTDPPEHRSKRSLMLPFISHERLRATEPLVLELVDELIDSFVGRGQAEFRAEFADCLPSTVMLRMIGLPREDEEQVRTWLGGHATQVGLGTTVSSEYRSELDHGGSYGESRSLAREYFKELLLDRLERPRDDFASDAVRAKAERDSGELDLHFLASEMMGLYGAGTFTTTFMLTNTLLALLRHPEALRRAQADPEVLRTAVEEGMRYDASVQWTPRYVTEDTELSGVAIPKGSVVFLMWGAAGRDPHKFEDPDSFVVDRQRVQKEQLGFGRGAHLCLGAPIARIEARVTFERMFARLPNLRLAERNDFSYEPVVKFRGPKALYIEFDWL